MTTSAPPDWAVGEPADQPTGRCADGQADGWAGGEEGLVRFTRSWWAHQLQIDPLTGSIAERRRIRPAIAEAIAGDPGPAQLAALDALLAAVGPRGSSDNEAPVAGLGLGLGLSSREWIEVVAAAERCTSYLHALQLNLIAALDAAKLGENPVRAAAKDTRGLAAEELAPVLRIAGRTASVELTRFRGHRRAADRSGRGGDSVRCLEGSWGDLPEG